MALPANATAWRVVKWLVKKSVEVVPPVALYLMDQLDDDATVDEPGWHRFVVRYSRATPAGTQEDFAQFKFDIISIADGVVDNSWTGPQFTAIATALDTFTTAINSFVPAHHTLKEYRAYRMRYNPDDPGPGPGPKSSSRPFALTGGPVYVLTKTLAGTAGANSPYQLAATCTFRTGWPKHWGRIYIPFGSANLDTSGRINPAARTTLANAAFDLQDDLAAQNFLLAVPVGQLAKQRFHGLLGVRETAVDDIPDVVRRRRPKAVAARAVGVE